MTDRNLTFDDTQPTTENAKLRIEIEDLQRQLGGVRLMHYSDQHEIEELRKERDEFRRRVEEPAHNCAMLEMQLTAERDALRMERDDWKVRAQRLDIIGDPLIAERMRADRAEAEGRDAVVQIDNISKHPTVSARIGVGDGSIADAVIAVCGALECAERERDEALARLAAREFIGYEYDCQDGHTETVVVEWDKAGCELADMRYRAELAEFKLKQLECTLSSDAAIERAEKAEAACAEMRAAWVKLIKSYQTNDWKEASDCLNAILADSEQIQRSDAGKGWHGPEEWAKQQADYEDVCNRLNDLEQEHEIAGEKGEVQLGQLRAENERLRAALGRCADHLELLRAVGVDYISGRARSYGEQILQTLITGYVPVPDESLDDRAQRIRGAEARARDLFEKLCRLAVEVPT